MPASYRSSTRALTSTLVFSAALSAGWATACGAERDFGSAKGGDAGSGDDTGGTVGKGGDSSSGNEPGSSNKSGSGNASGSGHASGSGGRNDGGNEGEPESGEGPGGNAGLGGAPGTGEGATSGDGGVDMAGKGGMGGAPTCGAFSCCISGTVFDANEVSPLNVCDECKPGKSQSAWTPADGKQCAGEANLKVSPKATTYKAEGCGTYCSSAVLEVTESVTLSLTFGGKSPNITSSEKFVLLDFANIAPSSNLNVTRAVLQLHAAPDVPTSDARWVTVKPNDTAVNTCKVQLPAVNGVVLVECDVTELVRNWLAKPADAARTIKVSSSQTVASATSQLKTELAANALERPVLLIDYSAKCAGNACPELTP